MLASAISDRYLVALAATLVIEMPIYVGLLTSRLNRGERGWARAAQTGVLANVLTHPVGFLVVAPLLRLAVSAAVALALVEIVVLVTEAAIVERRHGDPFASAVVASIANITSFALGGLLVVPLVV